jgi:heptosyltransferase-2
MTRSLAKPKPVVVGRYRYSKLRWRLLVHALDFVGTIFMAVVRRIRPIRPVDRPRRILVVQLDHLGDAVLSTPLLAELRSAYPDAVIDVLASPSNREVFEADPNVDRVHVAERTWFERRADRWDLWAAVWTLGRSLRVHGYDLGIDVRGDVLTVLVLTLAGVRRRVGWSMGGGAFLLTDVTPWIPGRHEVRSRLALLARLGIAADPSARVDVHVGDEDRIAVARRLAEAWPRRGHRRIEAFARTSRSPGPMSNRWNRSPTPPTGSMPIDSRRSRRCSRSISGPGRRRSAGRRGRGGP